MENKKGEKKMNIANKITEENLRYELARKKINIQKKCEYNRETITWTLKWYKEVYTNSSIVQLIDQLPLIKKYKKKISEVSGLDENDTLGQYSQAIVDNRLACADRMRDRLQ